MYNNIGAKIKGLTKIIVIIEAAIAVSIGLIMMFADDDTFLLGLTVTVVGCLTAWISSWLLYGFGEIVENTSIIARNSGANCGMENAVPNADRQAELYRLYAKGVISAEEYQKALAGGEQVTKE